MANFEEFEDLNELANEYYHHIERDTKLNVQISHLEEAILKAKNEIIHLNKQITSLEERDDLVELIQEESGKIKQTIHRLQSKIEELNNSIDALKAEKVIIHKKKEEIANFTNTLSRTAKPELKDQIDEVISRMTHLEKIRRSVELYNTLKHQENGLGASEARALIRLRHQIQEIENQLHQYAKSDDTLINGAAMNALKTLNLIF